MKRYLGFSKLSPAALRAIAKIVDNDDDFRARVAAEVGEDQVGRAGWLWLNRPDGWEEEVQALQEEARAAASAAAEERSERSARRKLAAARDAAERATATARNLTGEADRLRTELSEERARRTAAEDEVSRVSAKLEQLREERTRAVRELKEVESRLAARSAEANRANARLRELEVAQDQKPPNDPEAPTDRISWNGAELTDTLAAAADDASSLGETLARLSSLLAAEADRTKSPAGGSSTGPGGAEAAASHRAEGAVGSGDRTVGERPSRRAATVPVVRREAVKLPGGVLDDSVEAADHLLRTPNVLALIDGYNVTMVGWPDLTVAGQRARLLKSLDGVAASSGAEIEVIFDGAEVEPLSTSQAGPRDVRVRFSPPDVEADDVLLDLLAQIPPSRPVVVVSSDNRVRTGAGRQGANLVHARQLVALLRPSSPS